MKNTTESGTCGFKGKPTVEGTVEIGYEIAERYQNQGLATEAATALIHHAFRYPEVNTIYANTLAEENASGKVLQNLNFVFDGETFDVENGKLWKWRLGKAINV